MSLLKNLDTFHIAIDKRINVNLVKKKEEEEEDLAGLRSQ